MLIRKLLSWERPLFAAHLKRLAGQDRAFRFAHPKVDDSWIDRYVASIAPDDLIIGAFDEDALIGAVHVALAQEVAEIGVSVDPGHRGKGLGAELFQRATRWARNRRAQKLYTLCQADNLGMMALARRQGMTIHRDLGTAEAFLPLDPPDMISVTDEMSAGFETALHGWSRTCREVMQVVARI